MVIKQEEFWSGKAWAWITWMNKNQAYYRAFHALEMRRFKNQMQITHILFFGGFVF